MFKDRKQAFHRHLGKWRELLPEGLILKSAFAVFGALLFLSCSEDFKAIDRLSLEDLAATGSISGVSQKGPFRNGSSVVLSELDSNLVQSGRTFQAQIEDDNGSFEIRSVKLVSPYVLISVDGFYLNEVTGQNSGTKITLYAISDVTGKSSANINLMSHLEFHRVQSLADKGKDIAAAKKLAQGEILAVFGINGINFKDSEDMTIFGTSESDAALLAISVLLQNKLSEADFSVLLADFSQRLKASGVWDNEAKKTEIADWASGVDLGTIRSNIVGWGMSSDVPPFEKHVRNYWAMSYGLGECNSANNNAVKENANLLSANKDKSYVCKNSLWEEQPIYLCGGVEYNPDVKFCYNNYTVDKCGGKEYVPVTEECRYGVIYKFCAGIGYNSQTHFCQSGTTIVPLCGGDGGKEFESSQFCRGSDVFNKCNGLEYDTDRFCAHEIVPETVIYKCGRVSDGDTYNTLTEQCCPSGDRKYIIETQFCHTDDKVYNKCGGADYNPDTHECHDGQTYSCGGKPYNPATQFCYNNSKIGNKCGARTEIYDPNLYQCKPGINPNGIFLKNPVSYGGESYEAVLIGTQAWIARNLNYNASGSLCYGDYTGGDSKNSCVTYGRLYNWATAMGLDSNCNTSLCESQIQSKHRGICPSGWHIPSNVEWDNLFRFVDGFTGSTSNLYEGHPAGKHLKSQTGWNEDGNGTDDYGFSALPGGRGLPPSNGYFLSVGYFGLWWSSNEDSSDKAYRRNMNYSNEYASHSNYNKADLFSVRCVQD